MQNSLNKERNIVEFTSPATKTTTDVIKGGAVSPMSKINELPKTAQITPIKAKCVYVIKKDGTKEEFDNNKIINAVKKSATRMLVELTDVELKEICDFVDNNVVKMNKTEVTIAEMHNLVEGALEHINPNVAHSYRNYRNYKQDFVHMLDKVYQESQRIMYIGDKENANADSTLVSTKRSLIFNELNKELYKKFFLTVDELQAIRDGYIYIHDIVMAAASQQYGGFTVAEVDKILAVYAEKTFQRQYDKYLCLGLSFEKAREAAMADVEKDYEQGFQGWEYKFNTVASSRGDYPFITVTAGLGTGVYEKMATLAMLKIRRGGQGKKECKKPVLFPKIVFLYDENLHGPGKISEDLFKAGVECSKKTMYPDWLSLTGDGYVASMYKKYGKVVSPMGCRAFLNLLMKTILLFL